MNGSLGLSPGEIIVLSGLIAMTVLTVVSAFSFAVAYFVTREPRVATAAAPRVAAPAAEALRPVRVAGVVAG